MKFATDQDAQMFLVEIEKLDKLDEVTKDFKPDEEMMELFVKKRSTLIPGLKDFRRRQNTKHQWRKNRRKILKGIRRFHKSTAGKRFHRALGRFIATREHLETTYPKVFYLSEVADILKALSSLKTHSFIELEFYHPLSEELEYRILFEELIPLIDKVEKKILAGDFSLEEDDEELLLRIVDFDEVKNQFCELYQIAESDFNQIHDDVLYTNELTDEDDYYFSKLFHGIKEQVESAPSQ